MTRMPRIIANRLSAGLLIGVAVLLSAGCSDSRRQGLEGVVALDGQPLPEGSIMFLPEEGTTGPTAGANIEDGRFVVDARKGTFAGRFRVEIVASRETGKTKVDPMTGEKTPVRVQYIPSRYNTKSELTAEIVAGQDNRLEFNLTSKPK